ncbi:MAG TPA: type II secretion system protein [Gemmatimonadaceae bacterium]
MRNANARHNDFPCQPHPGAGPRRGHTLLEILIVVVILAGIAGLSLPRIDYIGLRLDSNARSIRGALQQAWRMSIQKQHDVLVGVDVVNRRLVIVEDANNDGIAAASERSTVRPLEEGVLFDAPPTGLTGPVSGPVAGPGVLTLGGLPTIGFHRNGSTSGDAELYLAAIDRGIMKRRAISVAQATGRTEWFRWANNSWRSGGN